MKERDELAKLILIWMSLPSGGEGDAADAGGLAEMLLDRGYRKQETQ